MSTYDAKRHPAIVFGAGGIGSVPDKDSFIYSWTTPEPTSDLLTCLSSLDIKVLDSAHDTPPGNFCDTNRLLGLAHASEHGFIIDSKTAAYISSGPQPTAGSLTRDAIRRSVAEDLKLLGVSKVRTMYVYTADPVTPLSETIPAFDELLREGKFEQVGLSNLSVAAVTEWMEICEQDGYTKPKLYQGHYNAIFRYPEQAGGLLEVLRKHNIGFYAFSPIAGGFLSGKVTKAKDEKAASDPASTTTGTNEHSLIQRTRFAQAEAMTYYKKCFDHEPVHDTMRRFAALCAKYTDSDPHMTPAGASLRWLVYHSALSGALGDGVIIGATREEQIRGNVAAIREGGPLPKEVKDFIDGMWDGSSLGEDDSSKARALNGVVQQPTSFYG